MLVGMYIEKAVYHAYIKSFLLSFVSFTHVLRLLDLGLVERKANHFCCKNDIYSTLRK